MSAPLVTRTRKHLAWRYGRIRHSVASAALVRETLPFIARELRRSVTAPTAYRLRSSGVSVLLRHHTDDTGVFAEIFDDGYYELDRAVVSRWREQGADVRIVDLGANIGLFVAWAHALLPEAHGAAYEPDAENRARLERLIALNGCSTQWEIVPAAAGPRAGTVSFVATGDSLSHVAEADEAAGGSVEMVDVLPALDGVQLLKMDIEGGEWAILEDPRFPGVDIEVIVMEYHPADGHPDARERAARLLESAGYGVEDIDHNVAGHGMLRAVRTAPTGR